ncbi:MULTISPECIES: hypothetical protein [Clostridium]|jgi:hypothetical protein|uniref:hypothetical protein n=1 Tax=Clostridium TaxID=1485 RepID=UPI00242A487D|nr:hypothetical protein [Clostridium tyrobutyricum]
MDDEKLYRGERVIVQGKKGIVIKEYPNYVLIQFGKYKECSPKTEVEVDNGMLELDKAMFQ